MASPARPPSASQFDVARLLDTATVSVRDVCCRGECRHRSDEECVGATHLVFPYRGTYLRHVGQAQAVADANHVLLFNAGEGYQVSHPVEGGDANLVLQLADALLDDSRRRRCDAGAQRLPSATRRCASMRARRRWSRCSGTHCGAAAANRWKPKALP